jgi:hypothetical protein
MVSFTTQPLNSRKGTPRHAVSRRLAESQSRFDLVTRNTHVWEHCHRDAAKKCMSLTELDFRPQVLGRKCSSCFQAVWWTRLAVIPSHKSGELPDMQCYPHLLINPLATTLWSWWFWCSWDLACADVQVVAFLRPTGGEIHQPHISLAARWKKFHAKGCPYRHRNEN